MAQLHPKFPDNCTNKELKNLVREYSDEIYNSKANINTVLQFSPLIQLGLLELQGRSNKKTTYLSLSISVLSLIIAGIALFISIQSGKFEDDWKNEQIKVLNSLEKISTNQVNQLDQINKANTEIKVMNKETNDKIDLLNQKIIKNK